MFHRGLELPRLGVGAPAQVWFCSQGMTYCMPMLKHAIGFRGQNNMMHHSMSSVWIVQHDESPHNTVVGVFATSEEANAFAEEAKSDFADGLLVARYPLGYRYDAGTGRSTYGPGRP